MIHFPNFCHFLYSYRSHHETSQRALKTISWTQNLSQRDKLFKESNVTIKQQHIRHQKDQKLYFFYASILQYNFSTFSLISFQHVWVYRVARLLFFYRVIKNYLSEIVNMIYFCVIKQMRWTLFLQLVIVHWIILKYSLKTITAWGHRQNLIIKKKNQMLNVKLTQSNYSFFLLKIFVLKLTDHNNIRISFDV